MSPRSAVEERMEVRSREVERGIHWIHQTHSREDMADRYDSDPPDWYVPGGGVNTIQNAYLLVGDERTMLFDTLDPVGRDHVVREVTAILDGRPLDYLAVSHPEAPHAGNAFAVLDRYPDATLIAPGNGSRHDLYHLEDATRAHHGDTVDLGDLSVEFLEPSFLDHGLHTWMRERTTDTLFSVDWLGHFVMDRERLTLASELERGITHHRLLQFHGNVFQWYQFVDTDKTDAAIENIIDAYAPATIATAHGLVIDEDPDAHMRKVKTVIEHISAGGRLTSL